MVHWNKDCTLVLMLSKVEGTDFHHLFFFLFFLPPGTQWAPCICYQAACYTSAERNAVQLRCEKYLRRLKKINEVSHNDDFSRKLNKTSWFILLQTDEGWAPFYFAAAAVMPRSNISSRWREGSWGFHGHRVTSQGGRATGRTPSDTRWGDKRPPQCQTSVYGPCRHFLPRHVGSCSVWSAFWGSLILSGLTMKAELFCSS